MLRTSRRRRGVAGRVDRHGLGAGRRRPAQRAGHLRRQRADARRARAERPPTPADAAPPSAGPARRGAADQPPSSAAARGGAAGGAGGTARDQAVLGDGGGRPAPLRLPGARRTRCRSAASSTCARRARRSRAGTPVRLAAVGAVRAVAARRLPRRAAEPARARLRPRPHELRSDPPPLERQHHDRSAPAAGRARSSARPRTGFTTFSAGRGPNSLLDQMWIRFDVLADACSSPPASSTCAGGRGASGSRPTTCTRSSATRWTCSTRAAGRRCSSCTSPGRRRAGTSTASRVTEDPTDATASLTAGGRRRRARRSSSSARRSASTRSSSATSGRASGIDFSTGIWRLRRLRRRRHPRRRGLQHVVQAPADPVPTAEPPDTTRLIADADSADHRRRHLRRHQPLGRQDAGGGRRELLAQVQRQRPVDRRRRVLLQPAGLRRRLALPGPAVEQHRRAAAELLLHRAALRGAVRVVPGAVLLELHDLHACRRSGTCPIGRSCPASTTRSRC